MTSSTIKRTKPNPSHSVTKAIAQYTEDARLHTVFEQSSLNFSNSSNLPTTTTTDSLPEQQITTYLLKIQRGGTIQPFGCMIAVDEPSFRIIGYSDNARDMLGITPQSVPMLERPEVFTVGTDVRTIFSNSSVVLLENAFRAREITLLNPIWVHSRSSGKAFYGILHRIDVGVVIDLEPARTEDPALSIAGAVHSQKLAVRAISLLQSLPGGDIKLLVDTVVESVRELTGYDRVMVYKFHEDEHGEVVAESKRADLEPYIGLHYPATDIPQASRFLFKQNRVRMIADCHASPVKVVQDEALVQPLCLVGSTLRAPHGCHAQYMANMGSIASLVMAVIINGNDEGDGGRSSMMLWGLVVCHHTSARYISFPLRYACEFLMQAFGLQLNMELQLASQSLEKRVLRTQTLLCDMLLRDSPTGIVTQSPSIMDLVKCDGAALYYQGNYHPLGVTPTESQIRDIIEWLLAFHGDSTGLSTDSLADAGYPGAASLGDTVCGMAVAYITEKDFLLWFRSHTAKEIKWGGAKHHPEDKDDGQRMDPRSSFKAFLEVVKSRSLPWENAEMDAIHSLQLILRDSFRDAEHTNYKAVVNTNLAERELQGVDELSSVAREMVRLIETATAPIFAVDIDGRINGWNAKVSELTGLTVDEAMGKSLVHDIVFKEYEETVDRLLSHALRGVTPTESQIRDIIEWLLAFHGDSTGLSTDSLADAGYPGAASLGDTVCGMAVAYITEKDFLLWFRSHTAKEIKWGGAKHHPEDKDDGQRMDPRSSFKAFLEVVKSRSLPWENAEMDAIHSLQLILRDSFRDAEHTNYKAVVNTNLAERELQGVDELSSVAREMVRLIETATAPIFAVDIDGRINGWNAKVSELTGLTVDEAMGKSLVHDIVFKEYEETVDRLLSHALRGDEDKNVEIKMRTFGPEHQDKAVFVVVNACSSKDYTNNIVGVCFIGQDVTGQKIVMDKFVNIQGDYKAIIHSPNPLIPPIFASDDNICCLEWNTAMENLTGWVRADVIGKMLVGEVFGSCCKLKGPDAMTKFMIVFHNALGGQDTDKFPFSFLDRHGKYVQTFLTANKRVNMDGQIIGAFCFLQIVNPELQQALKVQKQQEKNCFARMKELAYICQEVKNPLNGIRFTNSLLEATVLTDEQRQFLETSAACEKQMLNIIRDIDLDTIEDGSLELEKREFLLGNVINAVVSQVMLLLRERKLQLIRDIPEQIKTLALYGDQLRIQQVLADFLLNMVRYAPSPDGWVEIHVCPRIKQISDGLTLLHAEFRMVCPGEGLPSELIQDMFHNSRWVTQEGLGLSMSRKILKLMNGEVQYIREAERCYFLILLELPITRRSSTSVN
ncbi:hypothetical protein TanjilG_27042 [Lupinus angustifolius]|uniref:Phytochrome n=1 Tax=Lupinus angustifolius TaxID=3871 RepID=A0A4P1QVP8_LUPAN|nr:hypothetical protein TanjilG_27042 [Lupinus angustifolius]